MKRFLRIVNLPAVICCHIFGENHTSRHRITVGGIIMVVGVYVLKIGDHLIPYVSFLTDFTGCSLHAIGFYPILEHIAENTKNKSKDK